jgi:hypothetical protein
MNEKPNLTFNVEHNSEEIIWVHYLLAGLNIFLPWSIISWINVPLSLYAKDRLSILKWKQKSFNPNHNLYTNIALGIAIFYLVMSALRFMFIL